MAGVERARGVRDLKIAILMPTLALGGGTSIMLRYASALRERLHDVTILTTGQMHATSLPGVRVIPLEQRGHARFDVAIASWWEDVLQLPQVSARTYVHFIQGPEPRLYEGVAQEDATLVESLYRLPLSKVVVASWLVGYLADRYGTDAVLVENGIDGALFRPDGPLAAPKAQNRLRVLVEGPLGVSHKNVLPALVAATRAADETWLLTSARVGRLVGVGRVFSCIDPAHVPEIYRSCDVLLKLSRVEGLSLPPLEMLHCGGSVVASDIEAHREYITHGENGLLVEAENMAGVQEVLRRLRTDRALLESLQSRAKALVREWPSADESSQEFADRVERFAHFETPSTARDGLTELRERWAVRRSSHARHGRRRRTGGIPLVASIRYSVELRAARGRIQESSN